MIHYLLLFLLCLLFWRLRKQCPLAHPAMITLLVWIAMLAAYKIFNHGLYDLSDQFYYALLVYAVSFTVAAYIGSRLKFKVSSVSVQAIPEKYINILYSVTIICLIITILGFIVTLGISSIANLMFDARQNAVDAAQRGMGAIMLPPQFYFFEKVASVSNLFIIISLLRKNRFDKFFWLLFVLTCIYYCMRADKTSWVALGIAIGYIMYLHRISLVKLGIFAGVLLILLIFVQLIRDRQDSSYISNFLAIYILSPMPAFDLVLHMNTDWISYFQGEHIFWYIADWFGLLPQNFSLKTVADTSNFVMVPLPTNVFTVMKAPYMDWGYTGIIIFGAIYGLVWGFIYRASLFNDKYKIFYICCIWMLVMQFFADWLNWSTLIAIVFTLFFVFDLPIIFRNRNKIYCEK